MHQTLVLYTQPVADDHFVRAHEAGAMRAGAHALGGDFAGVGILTAPDLSALPHTAAVMSAETDPSKVRFAAVNLPPVPILGNIAHLPPLEAILFLFLEVRGGSIRAFGDELAGLPEELNAASYAFGASRTNVVVEMVSDDAADLTQRALALVDRPEVRSTRTLYTRGDLTVGFGAPAS